MDLGEPISFYVLERGAPVYGADGERVGEVVEVRADEEADIFDSLVVARGPLHVERHLVGADQVDEIYERGVVLRIPAADASSLPPAG